VIEIFGEEFDFSGFRALSNFVYFPTVDSTNAVARGLIDHAQREEVELAATVIAAATQTEGRGRRERTWISPEGGLYASFVFLVPEKAVLPHLPLAAAVWVARAAKTAGVDVRLKWPNDVLCGPKKLAGVLIQAKTRGEETHVAIGIGVNVRASKGLSEEATSIEEVARVDGRPPASIGRFFRDLCHECEGYLADPCGSRVVEEWMARSRHSPGDEMRVLVESGTGKTVEGRFAGLTEEGLLRLASGGSQIVVASGEVESW
jgi:BirA family transcriptional regulator, biotin operon repressor / biotin---[acetyl-CoA-carboxylase] ligase